MITQAAAGATNVASLVYIAAFAPDTGESIESILTQYPPLPSAQFLVPIDPHENPPFLILQPTSTINSPARTFRSRRQRCWRRRKEPRQPLAFLSRSTGPRPGDSSPRGTRFPATTG